MFRDGAARAPPDSLGVYGPSMPMFLETTTGMVRMLQRKAAAVQFRIRRQVWRERKSLMNRANSHVGVGAVLRSNAPKSLLGNERSVRKSAKLAAPNGGLRSGCTGPSR